MTPYASSPASNGPSRRAAARRRAGAMLRFLLLWVGSRRCCRRCARADLRMAYGGVASPVYGGGVASPRIRAFQRRDSRHVYRPLCDADCHAAAGRSLTVLFYVAYVTRLQCRPGVLNQPITSNRFPDCSYPAGPTSPAASCCPGVRTEPGCRRPFLFHPGLHRRRQAPRRRKRFGGRRSATRTATASACARSRNSAAVGPRARDDRAFGCAIPRGAPATWRARPRACRRTHKRRAGPPAGKPHGSREGRWSTRARSFVPSHQ